MNKNNQTEKLLAEALEEKEQRIKELTVKVDTLTKENKVLNGKLKSLSEKPTESPKSMVTWEDFQKEINAYKKRGSELAGQYFDLKSKYDKLCEERRYWVTQQWAKHLFRWLFLKRHLWIWIVYGMFITGASIAVYFNVDQSREIKKLRSVEMKYRFIKAIGVAPKEVQFLEEAYEQRLGERLDYIENTVSDYEKALKHKADSITKAERKKLERF